MGKQKLTLWPPLLKTIKNIFTNILKARGRPRQLMTGEEVNGLSCARRGSSCILEDVSSHSDAVAQADQGLLGSSSPEVFKNLFPLSIFCEEQRSTFWE